MIPLKDPENHLIQPSDIDSGRHFFDAFGSCEREISAMYIIRLCQKMGGWVPFTRKEIEALYNESGHRGFVFNGLDRDGLIVQGADKKFRVTHEFVSRCFEAAPAHRTR